ncbi:MAG: type II secretion system protein [Pseudomonadota bacterium]|nr:type II secretion system protein [Pseudomonadota bacterium]
MLLQTVKRASKQASPDKRKNMRGFTMIEISIALIVVGLLITPLFSLYAQYTVKKKLEGTEDNIRRVVSMMEEYRDINGEYPCPAPMNVARDDVNNGRAMPCDAATFAAFPQVQGECLEGICLQASVRGASDVIIGAVPFRDLQMSETDSLDGYGNRLMYAVTQDLTEITTFNTDAGGISIVDSGGNEMTRNQDAMFLVLSYGPSKEGAYSKFGMLQQPCSTVSTLETNNCIPDFGGNVPVTMASTDAIFSYAPITTAQNADTFDHMMQFHATHEQALWRRYNNTAAEIVHAQDMSQDRTVAIGVKEPDTDVELQVNSEVANAGQNVASIRINSGNLITDQLCDEAGTYCFEPKLLAGDVDAATGGMRCANADEYMVGIEAGQPVCEKIEVKCPDSKPVFIGYDTVTGEMKCADAPGNGCLSSAQSVCGTNDVIVSDANDGQTRTVNAGFEACAEAVFKCDNGAWSLFDTSKVTTARCEFKTEITETVEDCGAPGVDDLYGDQTRTKKSTTRCAQSPLVEWTGSCICGKYEDGTSIPDENEYTTCAALGHDAIASPSYFYDENGDPQEVRRVITTYTSGGACKRNAKNGWDLRNCECDNYPSSVSYTLKTISEWPGLGPTTGGNINLWDSNGTYKDMPARFSPASCPSGRTGTRERLEYFDTRLNQCKWKNTGTAIYRADTCACNNWPGYDNDTKEVACGGGFPGTLTQPITFNHAACKWVNNGPPTGTCTCDKDPANPPDETLSCGSGYFAPGSYKKRAMKLNTSTCQWVSDPSGAITEDNCNCAGPQPDTQPHSCDDMTCEIPDVDDQISVPLTPSCQLDSGNATITTVGSCKQRKFFWDKVSSEGFADPPPTNPRYIDDPCGCGDEGDKEFCYEYGDDSFRKYKCECRRAE